MKGNLLYELIYKEMSNKVNPLESESKLVVA